MEITPIILEIIDIVLKLILASLCGGLIGIYQNYNKNIAGLPYAMLVSLTSSIYVIIVIRIVINYNLGMDSLEILMLPVITGFAILGAAIILAQKASFQSVVQAFIIWAVAGVGMAIGLGLYLIGVSAGIISFVVLNIMNRFMFEKSEKTTEAGV